MPTGQERSHSPQLMQRPARWKARAMFQAMFPTGWAEVSIHWGWLRVAMQESVRFDLGELPHLLEKLFRGLKRALAGASEHLR